ncbi:MAG TPA: alpha/beta hydrolase [Thermoleophilaceae bacterium]|nr:alpha/beta hydrolase [Thermoleophilaceae bacterium]
MDERFCKVGDVELCYEPFGDPDRPAVLLVMGLGTQMLGWHEDFCRELAERGFFVIRYDNRDVGRSTRLDDAPTPTMPQIMTRRVKQPPYLLADMADDGLGLLGELGIERAHVVGASMGGMIAQTMAARAPERVESLVSIMSSTGSRWSGQPAPRILPVFLQKPAASREDYQERLVKLFKLVGSPAFERDDDELRELAGQAWDRGLDPHGFARQLGAILASGNRSADLRRIEAPTLVIHGKADRLVRPSGGRATAKAIPNAKLELIDGMGHDLPRGIWPRILGGIEKTARRGAERTPEPADVAG